MKIFRWLFSNLFLILLIVTVVYSYMYWGNLTGHDTPAGKTIAYMSEEFVEVEDFFHAIKEKQAELSVKQLAPSTEKTRQTEVDSTFRKNTAEAVKNTEKNSETYNKTEALEAGFAPAAEKTLDLVESETAVISNDNNQAQMRQEPGAQIETKSSSTTTKTGNKPHLSVAAASPSVPVISAAKNKEVFVPAEVENQLNNVDEQGKIIDDKLQKSSDVRSTWITARKSFYQRNYELSENSYLEVISNTEENFDAYGELGNVYFSQGKNRQAASAYFEAAAIMIRNGQTSRAKSLLGLLRHLDSSKAKELQKLIDTVNS